MSKHPKYTNNLIQESSPYLLQHAHNPVNWNAWNEEILTKAEKEQKLLIISIGYSACHWCHVMEHESFEDEEVANIMNSNYINIKVDREERPDIDQVYMNAVQLMTGMGGWPMNVVALPDGRPVWGGTYFKKEQWKDALLQIAELYKSQPQQLLEYAGKLEDGLKQINLIEPTSEKSDFHKDFFIPVLEKWKRNFDHKNGGNQRAPKFMIPTNYEFLLRYAFQNSDQELMDYCVLTLDKISMGGVFDPVGGGFSRYSVDERWHVPHFEKMLYDNAQLVQLYAKAFKITKNTWYKSVVEKTLKFIAEELTDKTGAFYSALDADSENTEGVKEEGAYYIWTKPELKQLLQDDFEIFSHYFNINSFGRWEEDKYVLIRTESFKVLAEKFNISEIQLQENINGSLEILKEERSKRKKPGLDNKSLTSWNAMMISGYTEAFQVFRKPEYLETAEKTVNFIVQHQLQKDGRLFHNYKSGKSSINAYLEDYAFTIEAILNLYEANFKMKYVEIAEELVKICEKDFRNKHSVLYNFTSVKDRKLVTTPMEINDNVIPSSNSIMAQNLFRLGKLTGNSDYIQKSENMLNIIKEKIPEYPNSFSNWLNHMINFTYPYYELALTGPDAKEKAATFQQKYLPNILLAATNKAIHLELLKNRFQANKNLIYVCKNGSCLLPLTSEIKALEQIEQV